MKHILRRSCFAALVIILLTLCAAGVTRASERAEAVMYGRPAAVLVMKQENQRYTLLEGQTAIDLPTLSVPKAWRGLVYLTPLGSVVGLVESVLELKNKS